MNSQNVFLRHEIKFLISSEQRDALSDVMLEHMIPDQHGKSTITNVYYDTPDFLTIRRSIEKPVYKEKIRIRSYGAANEEEPVFLELKKKYDGLVYKRRILIPQKDAAAFLDGKTSVEEYGQIGRELDYFREHYGKLEPKFHLCYDREAFYDRYDPEFRITFDQNIRWKTSDMTLSSPPGENQILKPGQLIMEVKTNMAIPLWLAAALEQNQIYKTSFSKVGTAYRINIEKKKSEKGE